MDDYHDPLLCVCLSVCLSALCSQSLADAKKQNNTLTDRLQALQTELSDSELRRTDLETQLRQSRNVRCSIDFYVTQGRGPPHGTRETSPAPFRGALRCPPQSTLWMFCLHEPILAPSTQSAA